MTHHKNPMLLGLIAGIVVLGTVTAVAVDDGDTVILKDGTVISGQITDDNSKTLVIRDAMSGGSRPLLPGEIKLVLRYFKGKRDWNQALELLENNNYQGALNYFMKVNKDIDAKLGKKEAYKYAYLYTAECAQKMAEKGNNAKKNMMLAAKYYNKYLDVAPTGRNAREAVLGAVDGFWATGNSNAVEALLPKLNAIDPAAATLMKGRLALFREKWDDAIKAVNAQAQKGSVPAQMILAQAQVGKGNLDAARSMADAVINSDNGKDAYKAKAYLVLGDINRATGDATTNDDTKKKNSYMDALIEYMRTALLYSSQEDVAAEALYKAIGVCDKLSKFSGESTRYRKRKETVTNMLLSRYASSPQAALIHK